MKWFKSKRTRLLTVVAALVLVVGACGFALTRGYLMRFVVNDTEISRDVYYQMAYDPAAPSRTCTADWTVGWIYFYEIHCFDSEAALSAYIAY